jgi:2-polyprenyl-6-methoxyphenol hydroxylase-like FAD-dependent oxidoreductase
MTSLRTEICVVGGGPAGAVAAMRLAQLGHDVVLLEKADFPRRHVGEGLSPGTWPLLRYLDIVDREAPPWGVHRQGEVR